MYLSLFAFCTGVLLVHFSPSPAIALTFFVVVALVVVFAVGASSFLRGILPASYKPSPRHLFRMLVFGLLGLSYAAWHVTSHLNAQITQGETGQIETIQGRICSIPSRTEFGEQVEFCTARGRYLLSLPFDTLNAEGTMCWQGRVKLKAPRSSFNPWVSSYERFLFSERIIGFANVKSFSPMPCSMDAQIASFIAKQRWAVFRLLHAKLQNNEHAGVLIALILGHRAEISPEDNDTLRITGTQHLMAISGLHVGIVCWLVFYALQMLRLERFAFPGVVVAGLVYIVMVGFSPSAQRAYVMVLCAMAVLRGRVPGSLWSAYLLALSLVFLLDPLAPLNPGFWFSFVAVFWLILIYHNALRGRALGLLQSMLLLQCLLALGLAPVQSHFAMPVSVFSLPANLVAIPWVSVVVLPLALFSAVISPFSPSISEFGFDVSLLVLNVLFEFLALGQSFDGAFSASKLHWLGFLQTASFCLLLVIVLAAFRLRLFLLSGSLLCLLLAMLILKPEPGAGVSQFVVLDVGQGLSLVAQHDESVWVYDTGPSYAKYSSAKSVLAPYLGRYAAGSRAKVLVISHGDADHAGDASWVAEHFEPDLVLLGEPERTRMPKYQALRPCMLGQSLESPGMAVNVLWPVSGTSSSTKSSNARSCVLRIDLEDQRFLIMGDIEGEEERAFVRHYVRSERLDELKADVLIAGHHGAAAATRTSLLKHVGPDYVVFSAGYANRFNHPAPDTVERVLRYGAEVLVSAQTGALIFTDEGFDRVPDPSLEVVSRLRIGRTREDARHYWLAR